MSRLSKYGFVVFAAAVLLVPFVPFIPPYWITLLVFIGLAGLVALGLVVLTGVGGMTSFGQAAFVGFGAYTSAFLTTSLGWSPWLTLPASLAVTGVAALLIGAVTVRLSGHYLPLGTIAWGISFYFLFGNLKWLGAYDGIANVPPLSLAGYALLDNRSYYLLVWIVVLLALAGTANLLDSRMGRSIRALRSGSMAAESVGVDAWRAKLVVFVYAALLAGLSGWLYAHFQRAVTPGVFSLTAGIEYLLMAVLGGAGHIYGALLGAGVVILLKDALQDFLPAVFGSGGNYEGIVFGALLIAALQWARDGLWPLAAGWIRAPGRVIAPAPPLPVSGFRQAGEPLLQVESVRKDFGGLVAVNDVSFSVDQGRIVGLIGPNGAGKSTTFNMITGVLGSTRGRILLDGKPIGGLRPAEIARHRIGRTFQHVKLSAHMSVLENVALGAHLKGRAGYLAALLRLDRGEEARIFAEAARQIDRVGLAEVMHRPADTLALGQQRLAEIARALMLEPRLLLLDEPAAGLRHLEKQALAGLLRELRSEGMSILLVEHDMDFVMGLTDHIVVINFGTRIAEGTPDTVRNDPAVIDAYLGASL